MMSYHSAKLGGHKHCDNGDLMFLEVKRQNSTCPRLDPP